MSIIERGFSGVEGEVSPQRYKYVVTPTDPDFMGGVKLYDHLGNPISLSESGSQLVTSENLVFVDQVDGAAVNINKWNQSSSGMTIAQAGGYISLNAGLATTANAYAILSSIKYMPMYGPLPIRIRFSVKTPIIPQANVTQELGIGAVATNAAPTDGCFFRWNSNGNCQAVVSNSGSENPLTITAPAAGVLTLYELIIVEDLVQFAINDELVAEIVNPVGIAFPTNAGRLPLFMRVYNSASIPAQAPQLSLGQATAVQQDMNQYRPWSELLATLGTGFYQSPLTPFTQTANHTNSTAPTAFTLSNTVVGAAEYAKLGGKFAINSQAAAATDGIVFAFQNEAGYQRIIYGIQISTVITGAAIVTATVLDWAVGVNCSAVSLATADGAGTWAPRRIPVGVQGFAALSGIGASQALNVSFPGGVVVDSGRYFHVICSIPNGAGTGSLIYRGAVTILGGYSE